MYKFIICFLATFVFMGCAITNANTVEYEKYNAKNSQKQLHVEVGEKSSAANGTIKGRVAKLSFVQGSWSYEVKGLDTSNQKLLYAKFTHTKKVAKKGDYVYAIITNGKLKEIFLINHGNVKQKNIKKVKKSKSKTYKRTKKRQILGPATTQSIAL